MVSVRADHSSSGVLLSVRVSECECDLEAWTVRDALVLGDVELGKKKLKALSCVSSIILYSYTGPLLLTISAGCHLLSARLAYSVVSGRGGGK